MALLSITLISHLHILMSKRLLQDLWEDCPWIQEPPGLGTHLKQRHCSAFLLPKQNHWSENNNKKGRSLEIGFRSNFAHSTLHITEKSAANFFFHCDRPIGVKFVWDSGRHWLHSTSLQWLGATIWGQEMAKVVKEKKILQGFWGTLPCCDRSFWSCNWQGTQIFVNSPPFCSSKINKLFVCLFVFAFFFLFFFLGAWFWWRM